jgi:hypothetical protein
MANAYSGQQRHPLHSGGPYAIGYTPYALFFRRERSDALRAAYKEVGLFDALFREALERWVLLPCSRLCPPSEVTPSGLLQMVYGG